MRQTSKHTARRRGSTAPAQHVTLSAFADEWLAQQKARLRPNSYRIYASYLRHHINRFGHYQLDLAQQSPPLEYDLPIPTKKRQEKPPEQAALAKRKKKPKKRRKKTAARQMKLFGGE